MRKTSELIDEIMQERKAIRDLTEELQEQYRILGALLLSAKALVPEDCWEHWLHANCDLNRQSAEDVMHGNGMDTPLNRLSYPHHPPLLDHQNEPHPQKSASDGKTNKKKSVKAR